MSNELKKAEQAAHAYDGLGAPMSYRPHVAELRRQVLGPDFNGVTRAVPERFSCEPVLDAKALDAALRAGCAEAREYGVPEPNDGIFTAAIRAYLGALSPENQLPAPVARTLTWNPFEATTPFGEYRVTSHPMANGRFGARFNGYVIGDDFGSVVEAKIASQADFEARIRSALSHPAALSGGDSEPVATHRTAGETIGGGELAKITKNDILREWFGGKRYARDYEYLDANYSTQAERVAAYLAALSPPPVAPVQGVTEALRELIDGVQEWCDAVGRDTSWDGWDHHYKHYAYNGGLDKARAALAAAPEGSGERDEHHEFVADPYRPSQCLNCGRHRNARIHDADGDASA